MFRASTSVTASAFHDRTLELRRLGDVFRGLAKGNPRWLAILGSRKIGKTSLVLEAARQAPRGVEVMVLDAMSQSPLSLETRADRARSRQLDEDLEARRQLVAAFRRFRGRGR